MRAKHRNTSLAAIERMAQAAVESLPAPFKAAARDVALQVVDWPPREMLKELGLRDPATLTGLYEGVPVTEKSYAYQSVAPDTVWLFRQPILLEWRERGNVTLEELVTHVTIHEFAHHFGWSDDDIASVDHWWE